MSPLRLTIVVQSVMLVLMALWQFGGLAVLEAVDSTTSEFLDIKNIHASIEIGGSPG